MNEGDEKTLKNRLFCVFLRCFLGHKWSLDTWIEGRSQYRCARLVCEERTLSYEAFGCRVTSLSVALRARLSRPPGEPTLVGLLLKRSIEMAVGIWAVLGCGACYVPIDPEYPLERLRYILEDTRCGLVLCESGDLELLERLRGDLGTFDTFCTEDWPSGEKMKVENIEQAAPLQLAYVIYTSGSTGRPKGVAIDHRAAANMVREQLALMQVTEEDRVLQFFKPAFDGAVQEYLSTFCGGACLVLWSTDFAFTLEQQKVTCATLTPSALAVLRPSPCLRKLAVAAEACPPALVETWARQRRLVNAYGPSENTVVSTWAELSQAEGGWRLSDDSLSCSSVAPAQHVPIGRPLQGVQAYVFEAQGKSLQPIGAPGELCLAGEQLAQGYFGNPSKTAERFVSNPLHGQRMYKTGDLCMWLPEGQLLYLGRNDEMAGGLEGSKTG